MNSRLFGNYIGPGSFSLKKVVDQREAWLVNRL